MARTSTAACGGVCFCGPHAKDCAEPRASDGNFEGLMRGSENDMCNKACHVRDSLLSLVGEHAQRGVRSHAVLLSRSSQKACDSHFLFGRAGSKS